jgi:hypothetical protein
VPCLGLPVQSALASESAAAAAAGAAAKNNTAADTAATYTLGWFRVVTLHPNAAASTCSSTPEPARVTAGSSTIAATRAAGGCTGACAAGARNYSAVKMQSSVRAGAAIAKCRAGACGGCATASSGCNTASSGCHTASSGCATASICCATASSGCATARSDCATAANSKPTAGGGCSGDA